jgi:hypothetical protein
MERDENVSLVTNLFGRAAENEKPDVRFSSSSPFFRATASAFQG